MFAGALADWTLLHAGREARPIEPLKQNGAYDVPDLPGRKFEIVAPYTLRIGFDDGTEQVVDFLPVLRGELYGPLRDLVLFNRVALDSEVHTLVWPNGADFDPAILHEWSRSGAAFTETARSWDSAPA